MSSRKFSDSYFLQWVQNADAIAVMGKNCISTPATDDSSSCAQIFTAAKTLVTCIYCMKDSK